MRSFNIISKVSVQCDKCGLEKNNCICSCYIDIKSKAEFWILTHENEFSRSTNTGRLIEYAVGTTKIFKWSRTNLPLELIKLINSNLYDIYLIMAADRETEKTRIKKYSVSNKSTVFLILDGTWKEARKILRKSDYLNNLKILSLDIKEKSIYDLRRNSDSNHLCTVEVAIELFKIINEYKNSEELNEYFNIFMEKYKSIKFNHMEGKND